eukprot:11880035-Karenia_brevis.AAC.1
MGYGQRAVFQKRKTKAPDENEMYQHQGLAWVVGAQAIIRLYRRCLEAAVTPQEAKTVIDTRFAATVCSVLKHSPNMGIPALNGRQDKLAQAIAEAIPREAKHNRAGYAEWVERILNQREDYRLAHNWTRGVPKAPPLPTSGTYDGSHYGHPSTLGPKFHRDWDALWVQEDSTYRAL